MADRNERPVLTIFSKKTRTRFHDEIPIARALRQVLKLQEIRHLLRHRPDLRSTKAVRNTVNIIIKKTCLTQACEAS
ncbi:MAG: hypothetical protein B6245_23280 [Desulfobacteraceae bacterium 4572_88]|nr:MAG: hypothetical protein B6245_23280 [Desulfobacteraceae bacterium 4572_88]